MERSRESVEEVHEQEGQSNDGCQPQQCPRPHSPLPAEHHVGGRLQDETREEQDPGELGQQSPAESRPRHSGAGPAAITQSPVEGGGRREDEEGAAQVRSEEPGVGQEVGRECVDPEQDDGGSAVPDVARDHEQDDAQRAGQAHDDKPAQEQRQKRAPLGVKGGVTVLQPLLHAVRVKRAFRRRGSMVARHQCRQRVQGLEQGWVLGIDPVVEGPQVACAGGQQDGFVVGCRLAGHAGCGQDDHDRQRQGRGGRRAQPTTPR